MMFKFIKNCRLFNDPKQIVHLAVRNGKIHHKEFICPDDAEIIFNAKGCIAAPGLIDTHVHGCGGANPADGSDRKMSTMAASLCRLGTTSFYATTFFKPDGQNRHLETISQHVSADGEADCLGLHIEGPFISYEKRGGIPESCIRNPNKDIFFRILEKCGQSLKIMTIAPELQNSAEIIKLCLKNNVLPSFGHSDADFCMADSGFQQGIKMVTHIMNAMRPFHHRNPGPLPAIYKSNAFIQMITDGVHMHPETIRFIYDVFGSNRCICITDGIESTGLPEGDYLFDGKSYRSENGKAFYSDDGGLIGTSLSLFEIMMRFKRFTGCSLNDAIVSASSNPAEIMGMSRQKGSLTAGHDADVIIIDEKTDCLTAVIKNGQKIAIQ